MAEHMQSDDMQIHERRKTLVVKQGPKTPRIKIGDVIIRKGQKNLIVSKVGQRKPHFGDTYRQTFHWHYACDQA